MMDATTSIRVAVARADLFLSGLVFALPRAALGVALGVVLAVAVTHLYGRK